VRGSDTVSRQGGDEFIVLVSFEPVIIATRMPEAHFIDPHELHVITSICVAVYPEDGLDAATLIKNEDIAMYLAKRMVARATSFSGRSLRP
jgi:diguanylate cyclase (GGDEF)-like protein